VNPSLDVIYAANLKPGDWWAGNFVPDAPTRPVQPFAGAHLVASVRTYADDDGRKWIAVTPAGAMAQFGELSPALAASQVLVLRHLEASHS
jgi:hypothetical protein